MNEHLNLKFIKSRAVERAFRVCRMHVGALGSPLLATADAKKSLQAASAGRHSGGGNLPSY